MDAAEKVCGKCGLSFPATSEYFHKQKAAKDGFQSWCKSCRISYEKARKKLPAVQQVEKARKSTLEYRAERVVFDRSRRMSEEYQILKQSEAFRELDRARHRKRNARLAELPNFFSQKDWEYALAYFDYGCAVCGRSLTEANQKIRASRDHWIPIWSEQCPGTVVENIVPLCVGRDGCNHSKHEHDAVQWLRQRYGLIEAEKIVSRINAYFAHFQSIAKAA